jgi:hypothetical protein
VTPAELRALLQEFYRDRLSLFLRHLASARRASQYDLNNAYQCVIAREDMHLRWIADAIIEAGGVSPDVPGVPPVPDAETGAARIQAVLRDDVEWHRSFVERWRDRVGAMTHARDRRVLGLILGEMLEHLRFFEQALDGRTDLLGRHERGSGARGSVLASRSLE